MVVICSMSLTTSIMSRREGSHCACIECACTDRRARDGRGAILFVCSVPNAANAAATAGDYGENKLLDLQPPLLGGRVAGRFELGGWLTN